MKRKMWWTLLGLPGVGLTAALLGQTVWGQPDTKLPLLPSVPMVTPSPGTDTMPLDVVPGNALPMLQPMQGNPASPFPDKGGLQPLTVPDLPTPQTTNSSPAPLLRTEAVTPATPTTPTPRDSLSYNVAPGKQQSAVSVEWAGPQAVRINQPMNCQLIVRNTSATPVQNVIVRHRPGQGVTCKNAEPQAVTEAGELTWNLGTLAPEQTRKIDMLMVVGARGVLQCNAAVTFTAVSAHHVQVREPMLAIKMRAPDKVIAGENVTLLLAVSNPGDGATEAVKVKATLPDGIEISRGKVVEFDVGNLAPKEIRTLQIVGVAKGAGMQKCTIVATANDNLKSSDSSQFEILTAKLDIALSGPKLRYLDRHAVYTLKVTNPGSAPASGVEVHELIPSGFKFHQANLGGKYNEQTRVVSWNLGDLQSGQTKDVAVNLVPIELGDHRIIAHAKTARGLKSEAETRTLVEGLSSLLIDVTHVDDPIEVGAETAFEIRVVNTGTKMESNVQLVCTLPDQLAFRGAKCSTTLRYRQEGQQLIFEPLGKLSPKADVIYRVQVKGIAAGDVRFRTRISADGLKEPMQREESMRIYSDDAPVKAATNTPAPVTTLPQPAPVNVAAPKPNPIIVPEKEVLPTPRINEEPSATPSDAKVLPAPMPIAPMSATPPALPTPTTLPMTPATLPTLPPSFPPPLPAPNIPNALPAPMPPLELPPPTNKQD